MKFIKNDVRMVDHGSPKDRGSADAYYGRVYSPHYFQGHKNMSVLGQRITELSPEQIQEYEEGFFNQKERKEY